MACRGPLPSSFDPGDNGIFLVTVRRGGYTIRRWIDRTEQDAEFIERERNEAYAHRYHTSPPTVGQQINEVNGPIFSRNKLACQRAANDWVGG